MIHAGGAARVQAAGGVRSLTFGADAPLALSSGDALSPFTIAFETYGALNLERTNAVLVCHPLDGDQFVASPNPLTGRPAWWPRIVGPGRPIDTNRFYVICANTLGGAMGTTGPSTPAPDGQPYGLRFPAITMADTVRAQSKLMQALGIDTLFLTIGIGFGGMQALTWASAYPRRVFACATIATSARQTAQNMALSELGRRAIMADPNWRQGAYLTHGVKPAGGAAVARAGAQMTGLSEANMRARLDNARTRERFAMEFPAADRNEHAGVIERFDANSYLYLSRAMDGFDLAADFGGRLANAFQSAATRHAVFTFSSDWRFPPEESRAIARSLIAAGVETSLIEINTDKGHDAYLGHEPSFEAALTGFVDTAATARGLALHGGGG